eukprot:403358261
MQLLKENIALKIYDLFHYIGHQELVIEKLREKLAQDPTFEPYSCFKRIARIGDRIGKRDFYLFLKENYKEYPNEDDCQFIVKYYDADGDKYLNFLDFNYLILPNDNLTLRAKATQQNNQFQQELNSELEEKLVELVYNELCYHIQTEKIKRELEQMRGFSTVTAFQVMDGKKYNFLDWDQIFNFLKYYANGDKQYMPTKRKVNGILRRLDCDADQKIAFGEFAEAIKPIDVYFTEVDDLNIKEVSPRKFTEMEKSELKSQLRQEYRQNRSAERTKPLRTFKSILNTKDATAIKELQSPIRRQQTEIMIKQDQDVINTDYSPIDKKTVLNQTNQLKQTSLIKYHMTTDEDVQLREAPQVQYQNGSLNQYSNQNHQRILDSNNKNSQIQKTLRFQQESVQLDNKKLLEETPKSKKSQNQLYENQSQSSIQQNQVSISKELQESEYSPVQSSQRSEQKQQRSLQSSHIKLIPKRLDKPEYNNKISPVKYSSNGDQKNFKAIQSRDINNQSVYSQFSLDSMSPEKFNSDKEHVSNIKMEMRYNMESQHKQFPFTRLIHQILNSLKVIEHEKELLYSQSRDFNILDAFRVFDIDGKGYISQIELISGLFDMRIEHTQAELNAFFRHYDTEGCRKLKFSDFSKAFLPFDKEQSLAVLKREPLNIKTIKKPETTFLKNTFLQYTVLWRVILRQIWEIQGLKNRYVNANCFDVEKSFFEIDKHRQGFIDKNRVSLPYLIQNYERKLFNLFFVVQALHK